MAQIGNLTYGDLAEQAFRDLMSAGSNKEARDQCIGRLNLIYANIRSRGTVMSGSGGDMKEFEGIGKNHDSGGTTQEWKSSFASATNRFFFTPDQITIGEARIKELNLQGKNISPEEAAEAFIKAASNEAKKRHESMKKVIEKQHQNRPAVIAPSSQGSLLPPDVSGGEDVATAVLSRSPSSSLPKSKDIV